MLIINVFLDSLAEAVKKLTSIAKTGQDSTPHRAAGLQRNRKPSLKVQENSQSPMTSK